MAKVVGIATKPGSTGFPVVLQNVKHGSSLGDVAEGKTDEGKVDLMQAISMTETISFDGEVDGDLGTLEAGQVLEYDSKDYLIKTADHTQIAGKVQTFACTGERKDDAVITGFDAPTVTP